MTESFDGDWLELREPFDAMARDMGLAAQLSAALPARPRILDLGAGTASLTRWLGHAIGRAQAWTLVDADPELITRAFDTLAERADLIGWASSFPNKRTLLIHAPHGAWRIEALLTNLALAPHGLPLQQTDAVVCSALCDLVSEDWITRMAEACAARRIPFYAALNTSAPARFSPPHRGDAFVRRGFMRDQLRDKGFGGRALGDTAPAAIARAFGAHGYTVHSATSPWRIGRLDGEMAEALSSGMLQAAAKHERAAVRVLDAWAEARADQIEATRLSILVPHRDVLALPPGA
jgi:SAM-dependent methyltransferase